MALLLAAADAGVAQRPLYYEKSEVGRAELEGRSLRELTLMRNWIYARAGNPFRRKWLRDYFQAKDWYSQAESIDESRLSQVDRANAAAVAHTESSLSAVELTRMRDAARAKSDELELRLISVRLGGWAGQSPAPSDLSPLEEPQKLEKLITVKQLEDFSPRDLKLLRNTIFARHGRAFTALDVKGHFATVAWYRVDPKYTDAMLTAVDKKNVQVIQSVEESLKPREAPNWYTGA